VRGREERRECGTGIVTDWDLMGSASPGVREKMPVVPLQRVTLSL
jgi:hypothetical protein